MYLICIFLLKIFKNIQILKFIDKFLIVRIILLIIFYILLIMNIFTLWIKDYNSYFEM